MEYKAKTTYTNETTKIIGVHRNSRRYFNILETITVKPKHMNRIYQHKLKTCKSSSQHNILPKIPAQINRSVNPNFPLTNIKIIGCHTVVLQNKI